MSIAPKFIVGLLIVFGMIYFGKMFGEPYFLNENHRNPFWVKKFFFVIFQLMKNGQVGIVFGGYLLSFFVYFGQMYSRKKFFSPYEISIFFFSFFFLPISVLVEENFTEFLIFFIINCVFCAIYLQLLFSDPGEIPKNKPGEWEVKKKKKKKKYFIMKRSKK